MNPRTLFLTAAMLTTGVHAADPAPEDLLRQGLFEEEANRDFAKAAERYHAVVAAHDRQRALAATATFRLGEIARKKSDKEAAAAAFRTVVERFPEQEDLARLSRENLAGLGMAMASAGPDPIATATSSDPEEAEIERLKNLAKNSPDLLDGATDTGWRPLHRASANGQMKVIAYLLENKADPNSRTTREQLTPLQLAAIYGQLAAVNTLLAAKAEVNGTVDMTPDFGTDLPAMDKRAAKAGGEWTALDLAILYDRREVARSLIQAGADIKGSGLRMGNGQKFTSLLEAIYLGRDEIALALIGAGAPLVPAAGKDAPSPLTLAIEENAALVSALLKAGADPNLPSGSELFTPLQIAVAYNRGSDLVKLLIEAGANPKAVNGNGQTALHFASTPEMVEFLVSKGADPNAKDKQGQGPLDAMAERGEAALTPAFDALLAKGAVAGNSKDLLGRTSRDMLPVVRERVVYPVEWRADAVLLSVEDSERLSRQAAEGPRNRTNWIERIEVRPTPGSPPPSLIEGFQLFYLSSTARISYLRIVRRDAEGHFKRVFDLTWNEIAAPPKDLPTLEWGDIVELRLSNSAGPRLDEFQEAPAPRTVTLRLGGTTFERKLQGYEEFWLGDRSVPMDKSSRVTQRRVRVSQPPVVPPPSNQRSVADLPLVPDFVDRSRVTVMRKGGDAPIQLDLTPKDMWPFRLIEGDVIDLVLLESAHEELQRDGKRLVLLSDWKRGGIVGGSGLFSILALLPQGSFDGTGVKVLRGGDPAKEERFDLSQILPEGRQLNPEDLERVNSLQPGDWIILPPFPSGADEKTQVATESLRGRIRMAAAQIPPRPPVQPPPPSR